MTLEEFVDELLDPLARERYGKGLVAVLEPYRESIERFTEAVDAGDEAAPTIVRAMWHRLEESDASLHRELIATGGGGHIT